MTSSGVNEDNLVYPILVDSYGRVKTIPFYPPFNSIATSDYGGNVILLDDFEDAPIKWATVLSGTGAAVARDTSIAYMGGNSLKLTTGSTVAKSVEVDRYFHDVSKSKIGASVFFTLHADIDDLFFYLYRYDGTNVEQCQIWYDAASSWLYHRASSGAWSLIKQPFDLKTGTDVFHFLKLVIDPVANEYHKLIIDSNEWDLDGKDLYSSADATFPQCMFGIKAVDDAGANTDIYIDNVIITKNEP